jgi:uncharacterized protein YlxP (DUF503 family)
MWPIKHDAPMAESDLMNRAVVAICTVSADLAKVPHYCRRKPGLITAEPAAREFFDQRATGG